MIPETSDGRVLFAVPWHNRIVLGTTDTPVDEASLEPRALEKEISFILETASGYFQQKPTRKDVLSVFAGLRPLAAPQDGEQKTKEISRNHKIIVSASGLFTILGGKWTTFRRMGEDMVSRIEKELGWQKKNSVSGKLPVHGAISQPDWKDPLYYYGTDIAFIRQRIKESGKPWISEKLHIHESQVQWAVEKEMARTVEDFLSRRTRALLLDAEESIRIAPDVAAHMAAYLGKGTEWIQEQVAKFSDLAGQYILKPADTRAKALTS
jgi:glycerol-3-phosphate dehydrogenase